MSSSKKGENVKTSFSSDYFDEDKLQEYAYIKKNGSRLIS